MRNLNTIITIIVLAAIGCNESVPLNRMEIDECRAEVVQCRESEDYAWSQVRYYEEATIDTEQTVKTEYPTEDWQARAEFCEPELLGCRAAREMDENAYEGLLNRARDLEKVVLSLDVEIIRYNCDNGNWAAWICQAYN